VFCDFCIRLVFGIINFQSSHCMSLATAMFVHHWLIAYSLLQQCIKLICFAWPCGDVNVGNNNVKECNDVFLIVT